MKETYKVKDFDFEQESDSGLLTFLVLPSERKNTVFGVVFLSEDNKGSFQLEVYERAILNFYAFQDDVATIRSEEDVEKNLYFPMKLRSKVREMYEACKQFVELYWSKQDGCIYRFDTRLTIDKPKSSRFRMTHSLQKWYPANCHLHTPPVGLYARGNTVTAHINFDAVLPTEGAKYAASYLLGILQSFDIPDAQDAAHIHKAIYEVVTPLLSSKYDQRAYEFAARDFDIKVTVERIPQSNE